LSRFTTDIGPKALAGKAPAVLCALSDGTDFRVPEFCLTKLGIAGIMTELADLPPKERAEKYRQFAVDADAWAQRSNGPARQSYLLIAEQWRKLAEEIEGRFSRSR
jgi:hypothetical protein